MSPAGWKEIVDLVFRLVAVQPPYLKIAIGLGVAFSVLMFIEGLRANFIPRRNEKKPAASNAGRNEPSKAVAPMPGSSVPGAFRRPVIASRIPKRGATVAKPHRAPRPKIRRISSLPSPAREDTQRLQTPSFEE
jgi:hypothetical protein